MSKNIIELKNVGKKYTVDFGRRSLLGAVLSFACRRSRKEEVWAVNDIDLCIQAGETVGIIGENASGKTTLLRIISQITTPTKGEVSVNGKIAGLLDLGAGFPSELTGRECVYLNAALLGMDRKETEALYDKIVEFSGLARFIDAQVKTYSQGMLVRLGFSVAIHVDPEVLLIDDTLAVGDEEFQRKCLRKVSEFKEKGKTIIIVSHDLNSLSRICERGILLQNGTVIKDDSMHSVIVRYIEAVGDKKSVACIDKELLSVIFNNGKIIFLWNGRPMTKNFGGYISLEVGEQWLMSWTAEWCVVEQDKNCWKAEGLLRKYGIKITLACNIDDVYGINLQMSVDIPSAVGTKKVGFGFMLNEKYNDYLHDDHVSHIQVEQTIADRWVDLFRTDEYNAPLVLIPNDEFPVVMARFKQNEYSGFGLIQTTDNALDARVMQMHTVLISNSDQPRSENLIIDCNAELQLIDKANFEAFITRRCEERIVQSGDFKLQLDTSGLHLFCRDQELTKDDSLRFGFFCKGYYFNILSGEWQIEKDTESSFVIRSEFKNLDLRINLVLRLNGDCLEWQIYAQGQGTADLQTWTTRMVLSEAYDRYFDLYEEHEFIAAQEYEEQVTLSWGKSRFIGLSTVKAGLPVLILNKSAQSSVELRNARFDVNARILISNVDRDTASGSLVFVSSQREKEEFIQKKQKNWQSDNKLSNDNVSLDFSQDKIRIYKNDIEITSEEGLCSGIFYNDRWYDSTHAFKEFKKEGNTLKVNIKRQVPQVNELWTIALDGNILRWLVEFESDKPLPDFNGKAGIMLKTEFTEWMHAFDRGSFLQNKEDVQTVDINDVNNKLVGLKSGDSESPVVLFESKHGDTHAGLVIQAESKKSRSLQFKFQGDNDIGLKSFFSGEIKLLNKEQLENNVFDHLMRNFTLTADNQLKLFAALTVSNQLKLFLKDRELTKAEGLDVYLLTNKGSFNSRDAIWRLKKVDETQINIELAWGNDLLTEEWCFEVKDGAILWSVILHVKKELLIKNFSVNIITASFFDSLVTLREKRSIDFMPGDVPTAVVLDNRSNFIGVFQEKKEAGNPVLILNPLVSMQEWFLRIYKDKTRPNTISCGAQHIINTVGMKFISGAHEIFKGKLIALEGQQQLLDFIKQKKQSNIVKMQQGNLSIELDKAHIRLFWKNQELTKALGLYTACLVNGEWMDSTLAAWDMKEISSNEVDVSLFWNRASVFQKWRMHLLSENEIMLQVCMDIQQEDISSAIAGIMLDSKYKGYSYADAVQEEFPLDFQEQWESLFSGKSNVSVFAEDKDFPDLIFDGKVLSKSYFNVIENTDYRHAGRLVKCEVKFDPASEKLGKSVVFEIRIRMD
ncbi:MAG: ABC transporter ATP-binding protein [PVC group bacterium]|nr:ABC transporter ATP-binding protein [PVC group bacterium]